MQSENTLETSARVQLWRGELANAWQAANDGIARTDDDRNLRAYWALGGMGKILLHRRCFRDAMPWLEQAIQVVKAANAPMRAIGFESELALCHLDLNDSQTVLSMLQAAEKASLQYGAMHLYQVISGDIANVYLHQGEYWTAVFYYQRALSLAKEMKDPVKVANWTGNIRLAYAKMVR